MGPNAFLLILSQVLSVYIVVLWYLTFNNIVAPLAGFGSGVGQKNLVRTFAFLGNLMCEHISFALCFLFALALCASLVTAKAVHASSKVSKSEHMN